MNFQNVFNDLAKADPEFFDRVSPRRATIRTFLRGASLAALPVALGGLFKKAYGQGSTNTDLIIETLNLALTAEYLEVDFYTRGLASTVLVATFTDRQRAGVEILKANETAHKNLVYNTIERLRTGAAIPAPTFDFTGGNGSNNGPFQDWNTNKATFFGLAQGFEDNGVRAYKGGAPNLMSDNAILTAALNIHSVEARHAAWLRKIRREDFGQTDLKPWITGTANGLPAAVQGIYAGEDNTTHAGVQVVGLPGAKDGTTITAAIASEAFDEPLTAAQVRANVDPFTA